MSGTISPGEKENGDRLLFWQRSWTPSFLERGRETKRDGGGHLPAGHPEGLRRLISLGRIMQA
jgi:hypothetical protein